MSFSIRTFTNIKKIKNRVRTLYRIKIKPTLLRKPIFFIYKKLGLSVVTRDDLVSSVKKYHVRQFGCEELVTADEPYVWGKIPKEMEATLHSFNITINKPFVCEVANAELAGPAAVGFDEKGNIIQETTAPIYSTENHLEENVSLRTLALRNLSKSSVPQVDTACSLINNYSKNYWYWMIHSLTRLEGVEFYHQQTGTKPVIIIEANPTLWQTDSLKLLGYEPKDCIHWNNSRIQVKKLIISSYRKQYDKVYTIDSPLASRWIRQRMLGNLSEDRSEIFFSPKVFISRRKAFSRQIVNENDVIEALATLGFVAYSLEEMSFLDQVRLFSQAKIIVAPHGAGLTNMIFAQNLTIIELICSSIPLSFANLSRGLGFQYGCFNCQPSRTGIRRQDSDMMVNIAELKNFVAKMMR